MSCQFASIHARHLARYDPDLTGVSRKTFDIGCGRAFAIASICRTRRHRLVSAMVTSTRRISISPPMVWRSQEARRLLCRLCVHFTCRQRNSESCRERLFRDTNKNANKTDGSRELVHVFSMRRENISENQRSSWRFKPFLLLIFSIWAWPESNRCE